MGLERGSYSGMGIKSAIMEKRLVNTIREYLAKQIITDGLRFTYKMNYVPQGKKPVIEGYDYVRTATLELMAHEINDKKLDGSVAELGVYQGDFAKFINQVFPDRRLYLFDTFEGFDETDVRTEIQHSFSTGNQDFSETEVEMVLKKMPNRSNVVVKKGWFPDTTEGLDNETFVFVSIDADLYDPIYEGLKYFYPRLQHGGMIFVHDFNNREYEGSAVAVKKFADENGIGYLCIPDVCGSVAIVK